MKGISNEKGITFADLIDFVDNNRSEIPGNFIIRLNQLHIEDNSILRDIIVDDDLERITLCNHI